MDDLQGLLERGVAGNVAPGLAAAILKPDGARLVANAGIRGLDNPAPLTPDTIFYVASCTKPVTSVAALQLVERGLLGLDEPVGRFLPALAAPDVLAGFDSSGQPITRPARSSITVRQLLSHTSGLAYTFSSKDLTRYVNAKGLNFLQPEPPPVPLVFEPGEGWIYGTGLDWAGRLIEAVTGQGLDAYCAENIFAPLGLTDTSFFPSAEQRARKASVHFHAPDGSFIVAPFEMPPERHFWMGGAGLYAPAAEFLKFLTALATGGRPLLGPAMFEAMMQNQVGGLDAGLIATADPLVSHDYRPFPGQGRHGLAGVLNADAIAGGRSANSFTWAGITNCYYWVDPTAGAAGVLMSQVMPFGDQGIFDLFRQTEAVAYA